jgi:hypothetical protein
MKFNDLPIENQWYEVDLGDRKFSVNGSDKIKIVDTTATLIVLGSGEVINRNFIRSITKDIEKTKETVSKIDLKDKKMLES